MKSYPSFSWVGWVQYQVVEWKPVQFSANKWIFSYIQLYYATHKPVRLKTSLYQLFHQFVSLRLPLRFLYVSTSFFALPFSLLFTRFLPLLLWISFFSRVIWWITSFQSSLDPLQMIACFRSLRILYCSFYLFSEFFSKLNWSIPFAKTCRNEA